MSMKKETKTLRERVLEQEGNETYYTDPLPVKNIVIGVALTLSLAGAAVYGIGSLLGSQRKPEIRSEYQEKPAEPSSSYKQNETYLGQK